MKALDLFCGAGGASKGLKDAGFHVTGVDIAAQPRYAGDVFIQADATNPPVNLADFDFIWASPPCQAHTSLKTMHNAKSHLDLIPATRELLDKFHGGWVIENVVGAPLNDPTTLCGTMFDLGFEDAQLRRHRIFKANFEIFPLQCSHNHGRTIGIYGEGCRDSKRKFDKTVAEFSVIQGREAMGIDWMSLAELCQSIPPAYSNYIAKCWFYQS